MQSIRIKNLRSLVDTGEMHIKPINVILGANSSGKSSYLRFFPLLKQTISRKIRGVLFWSGYDQDDVDFGSFDTALNNQENHEEMEFIFSFKITKGIARRFHRLIYYSSRYRSMFEKEENARVSICLKKIKNKQQEIVSRVHLEIFGVNVIIDVEKDRVSIDRREYQIEKSYRRYINNLDSIFQLDLLIDFSKLYEENMSKIVEDFDSEDWEVKTEIDEQIDKDFQEFYVDGLREIRGLEIDEKRKIYYDMLLVNRLEMIMRIIDSYLTSYFNNSVYIAPLRATAERYYRLRNLSIEEVDPSGRNLVEFLYNIDEKQFIAFQYWTNTYLGFQVEKDISEIGIKEISEGAANQGYVSINIRKKGQEKKYNLSDTGFGYSQILPIVTQLWSLKKENRPGRNRFTPKTVIIEQPELHLHPELQSKLVSAICSLASNEYRFIIETHSETIINKLGRLVNSNELSHEDVNLQFFSKSEDNDSETIVTKSTFDSEGYLENWPVGFFDGEEF